MVAMAFDADDLFRCQCCGQCCQGFGGTYVTGADIEAIAAYLDCAVPAFRTHYLCRSGSRLVLAQRGDGYCVFWQDNLCTIHPVKPLMCRRWPFIPAVLKDVANWHAMAATCPGMRTDAADETIRAVVARVLARESVSRNGGA
jgi:Fe-S-cluster containining protein